MAWLKKFIEYSREIDDYTGLCTCPAHSEYQTALIFHSAKNLKLYIDEGKVWLRRKYGFNSRWSMQQYVKFFYDKFFEFNPELQKFQI